jgi:A/G-specific adenine glycosylase
MNPEVSQNKIRYFRKKLIFWGRNNYATFPWRSTKNQWHALVAEIMLQRTDANQVVPAFNSFCQRYNSPEDYLHDENSRVFATLGLHWREKLLQELTVRLSGKTIPTDRSELLNLPGVGDYIASAYRSMHLGIRDRIIDSNVVRLYGRFFGFKTNPETRRKRWFIDLAEIITPQRTFKAYNYALIDFTREICRHRPKCNICILNKRCKFYQTRVLHQQI